MRVVQMGAIQDYSLAAVKLPSSLFTASGEAAGALGSAPGRGGVAGKLSSLLGLCEEGKGSRPFHQAGG